MKGTRISQTLSTVPNLEAKVLHGWSTSCLSWTLWVHNREVPLRHSCNNSPNSRQKHSLVKMKIHWSNPLSHRNERCPVSWILRWIQSWHRPRRLRSSRREILTWGGASKVWHHWSQLTRLLLRSAVSLIRRNRASNFMINPMTNPWTSCCRNWTTVGQESSRPAAPKRPQYSNTRWKRVFRRVARSSWTRTWVMESCLIWG